MFHAFTGCDTVSFFKWKGKKKCWDTWEEFEDVSEVFMNIHKHPFVLLDGDDDTFKLLEQYVMKLYDKSQTFVHLAEARKFLFCKRTRSLDRIPPTQVSVYFI